jgi:hypothetical protein
MCELESAVKCKPTIFPVLYQVPHYYGIRPETEHLTIDTDARRKKLFSFTPWWRYSRGNSPQYPVNRRSDGLRTQPESFGEEGISCP